MSAPFQPGDTVTLSTTFRVAGTLTDPTTVSLDVREPDGTTTTYTWAGATVTKDATGTFSKALEADAPGIWAWKWTGTGAAAGIDEGTFTVDRTLVGGNALCSVDDVKLEMEASTSTGSDDLILRLIVAASKAIVRWTGREFVAEGANPQTRLFDLGVYARHAGGIGVPVGDMQALPSAALILDAYGATTSTLTPATDLVALPLVRTDGRPVTHLRLRPNVASPTDTSVLSVTGSWGWPVVPEDVAHACVVTVRSWMRSDAQGVSEYDGFSGGVNPVPTGGWMLPTAAKQLLAPYRPIGVA